MESNSICYLLAVLETLVLSSTTRCASTNAATEKNPLLLQNPNSIEKV